MAHIFISYSHQDIDEQAKLVEYLVENGFSVWYDHHIQGGDNWRNEINAALEEAFAVLFIVTANSVNSHYCTYEWAYALGSGTPVIPLIFEDVNITQIHQPLHSKQFIPCLVNIPAHLANHLKTMKQEPIDVTYLRRQIMQAIMPFRIYMEALIWCQDLSLEAHQRRDFTRALALRIRDEAAKLYFDVLPELMTLRSHSFPTKLKRTARQLIDAINDIHDLLQEAVFDNKSDASKQIDFIQTLQAKFEDTLTPLIVLTIDESELFSKYVTYLQTAKTARPDPFSDMDIQILYGVYLDEKTQEWLTKQVNQVLTHIYTS